MGKILAICTSPKRGTVKTEVPEATLTPEWGIETDAHGGNWHRHPLRCGGFPVFRIIFETVRAMKLPQCTFVVRYET